MEWISSPSLHPELHSALAAAAMPQPTAPQARTAPERRRPLASNPLTAQPAPTLKSGVRHCVPLHPQPQPFLPLISSLRFQESMFLSPNLSLACAVVAFPWRPSSQVIQRVPCRCNLTCHAAAPKVPLPIASPADPSKWDPAECDALLRGGEQVASVLQEMLTLMEDMEMDGAFEPVVVELVAQGVIGKRVDEMESGFLMALDYMIQLAQKDADDERKSLLEVIKQTVLDHLTKKCPPHVQVVGLLCQTEKKESRHELLRRVAAGGGVFKNDKGLKCQIPGANLSDIANQADDLLESMESRDTIPDRKLLARLVIVREEARNMMGGGLLDERNDRGLATLPEAEVNFLSKLVAIKPGKALERMIKDVMNGRGEGADNIEPSAASYSEQESLTGVLGRGSVSGHKPRPVRPGMFLETVSKVLGGVYASKTSGIAAQHLEWVHQTTLKILQEMAF